MKKIIVALTALFSILTISCEIGLGSSVDTDPPALNILNPPVDAIIRDDFSIGGTWSDDGTIESIAVELSRTDGNGQSLKYTGVFNEDPKKRGSGNWYSEIPAVTAPVTDGTYQAVVTIKDTSGRTTTQSTTFTIFTTEQWRAIFFYVSSSVCKISLFLSFFSKMPKNICGSFSIFRLTSGCGRSK